MLVKRAWKLSSGKSFFWHNSVSGGYWSNKSDASRIRWFELMQPIVIRFNYRELYV